jgi:hypothetical protein
MAARSKPVTASERSGCGLAIPLFSAFYSPFWFVGFLLTVGLWTVALSIAGVLLIHWLARSMLGGTGKWGSGRTAAASTTVMGAKVPAATRRRRMVHAMMKALFVAVASGNGGKIGGWIGGVLVFVISAGVSAYFEIPFADTDHSQH